MGNELKPKSPMNVTSIDVVPKPLKIIREQAKQQLSDLLSRMFDSADDVLFERADKAGSSTDQTMYFDSMREVRIKRQKMGTLFSQAIHDGFRLMFQMENQSYSSDEVEEADSLSLVNEDELEQSVAVHGMISKVLNRDGIEIEQLTLRLDSLVHVKAISLANNPIAPQGLCNAFDQASSALELDIRSKLVVYKLFDKFVLGETGQLYEAANTSLIDLGIKPKLKNTSRKKILTTENSKSKDESSLQQETKEQKEVFNFLRGLLNESRQAIASDNSSLSVADSGPALSNQDVVQLLSSLQSERRP